VPSIYCTIKSIFSALTVVIIYRRIRIGGEIVVMRKVLILALALAIGAILVVSTVGQVTPLVADPGCYVRWQRHWCSWGNEQTQWVCGAEAEFWHYDANGNPLYVWGNVESKCDSYSYFWMGGTTVSDTGSGYGELHLRITGSFSGAGWGGTCLAKGNAYCQD
jgi:hypothetical protein